MPLTIALAPLVGWLFRGASPKAPWNDTAAIREVLFSVERLQEHAQSLALTQGVKPHRQLGHPLLDRLAANEASLIDSYRSICTAVDDKAAITPAAEWLIDNFHLVERQIREIRLDLPPSYYRQLPKLADGPFVGLPRVFGLVWAFVAHTDSRFDVDAWCAFIQAYQEEQPLTIGELWASAITLRIILIENLRRIAERIVYSRDERRQADAIADHLMSVEARDQTEDDLVDQLGPAAPSDALALQLIHRLRDQSPALTAMLGRLDERLAADGRTTDSAIHDEQQRQISANVTVRNIITSMRHISDVDWSVIFERVSLIDPVLAKGCDFTEMDFATRNLYRTAVEQLARGSGRDELDVANRAVEAAAAATERRRKDPGYYLTAEGRPRFEAALGFRPSFWTIAGRAYRALGVGGYAGAGALVALVLLGFPVFFHVGASVDWILLGVLGLLGAVPAIDSAVALVNQGVTRQFGVTQIPGLELRDGIPDDLRTLVVVPTLLTRREAVIEQVERLEIHYLASIGGEIQFALLSDWPDAASETIEGDDEILHAAVEAIATLNQRHAPAPGGDRFLLLHRRRVWNESQRRWIGWERKRGKLHELNRLLRGARDTTFLGVDGRPPTVSEGVRYVITLDADTRLPPDTVRRLIGKMAHPLNQPIVDPTSRRVVEGYAILQPRVTPNLPVGDEGSAYQRAFSSPNGIDPYSAAVSDVYQDLFGEGSYAGKGIYAVDAFETVLADRVPDSTLLSHDLFEGVFARAGLASDVEVVESYPTRYDVASLRYHRWTRGDWQLLPWILGWSALLGSSRRLPARMPSSGRWKMVDNLRRSVTPLTCVLALLAGWALPFDAALVWTLFFLATIALPSLSPVLASAGARHPGIRARVHFARILSDLGSALTQILLLVTLLAHQAWLMADAVIRTLFRLFITRRNLLQWTPAAQATIGPDPSVGAYYRWMAGAVVTGVVAIGGTWLFGDRTVYLAAPFATLWIASPAIARWVSRPSSAVVVHVANEGDRRALRLIARRTWRYFETFVTPNDNMLPPDNFQETPSPVLARRTSPTNLGLYLLSTASAHDFGWTGALDTIDRLEATMATMAKLDRFRGHFYNWYDTESLRALDPQYVSSVDSGNLAGHLIALANSCQDWCDTPLEDARRLAGTIDALCLVRGEVESLRDRRRTETVTWRQLDESVEHIFAETAHARHDETFAARLDAIARPAETLVDLAKAFAIERGEEASDIVFWAQAVCKSIESHQRDLVSSDELAARFAAIGHAAREMALAMEFDFLLNEERLLLSVGFVVRDAALDESCYDLLASEARLASFIAIAKGDLPARHWFRLGHGVTPVRGGAALLSWSGSMFEYLMPALIMRAPTESIIGRTNRAVIRKQIEYARALATPWGISESAYNARDLQLTYQYSNFGIPGLGLKRGLGEDAVVAPYATALAAIIDPVAAARNFRRLANDGARGRFGFFEALDFTPRRLADREKVAIVRAFMAHHQGMTIVAIADALLGGVMRERFHAEPIVRAAELLLHERMPREIAAAPSWASDAKPDTKVREVETMGAWRQADPNAASPATHLLSNGRYSVMLTAAGSGYSRWRELAVTRWREDATCDDWGSYIYLRDIESDLLWSATYQPTSALPDQYSVVFSEERATYSRQDGDLHTTLEVVVSTEDDAEVRRLTISNNGGRARAIEVTSYAEIAIAPQAADAAHPVFSKLFVETEYVARFGAILATRRRRSPDEPEIWAAHHSVASGEDVGKAEFETDRARFLGRGLGVRTAAAAIDGRLLSRSTGAVLDPIFALRRRVHLAPGAAVRIDFWTLVAESRENLLDVVDRTNDISAFDRAVTLAWTQAQVQLHHLGIDRNEASEFQRLAGHLIFAGPSLRPSSEVIMRGAGPQSGLWSQSISGDLPIILLRIANVEDIRIVHQLLQAMEYWRARRLEVDLVILNERASSYIQDLQSALETTLRTSQARAPASLEGVTGQVFVLRADLISSETLALLGSAARVRLTGDGGGLTEQLNRIKEPIRPLRTARKIFVRGGQSQVAPAPKLEFFNGIGGFAEEGREYVITLAPGQATPAPWINVIANSGFGFQISAEGCGFTWSVNSREHQLTPWSNDPVTDRPGEAIYLRDEDSGELWCPTALPIRDDLGVYVARHGWGYSRFEHEARGIASDLLTFVPVADPIRIARLKLRNTTDRLRRLSVTAYVEWVLGTSRSASAPFVSTEIDPILGAIFARNPWNAAFPGRVAFLDLGGRQTSWTGDRREFLGRNGCLSDPVGLDAAARLSGTVGAGLDPCGAMCATLELAPGTETEIVILFGDAEGPEAAAALIARYRDADLDAVLAEIHAQWEELLGTVRVETPDRSIDIMLNGWLIYQTISCRLWARSGFYQASGAYGFRDQLQDGMALTAIRPSLTREHLVSAAGRQFAEGDVQHWWLPHSGQGVRTRISDDRLWLAFCVAHYLDATGDASLLDEIVPFLEGPKLEQEEQDSFFTPTVSDRTASVYEHCALAIDASLARGNHGLPLIGGGDWNDGMNRVGEGGKGESVWLGWLSHMSMTAFAAIAKARGEADRASKWRDQASALQKALERDAWDGGWYRRAWFDDGTAIGSAASDECRIDSIAQSWAVMSGVAKPERASRAMAAVERELIRFDDGLALLFTPPFDRTAHDPGYIKGYPPGIRENGGQYTHGAIWSVIALARLGEGAKAAGLFSLLNPINHSRTRSDLRRYKVEPYVVAADVYSAADHLGRGGWTWYTGSAAWLYRAGMEEILGLRLTGSALQLDPCIPESWPGFQVTLRRGSSRMDIRVDNPNGVAKGIASARIDGTEITERPLRFDLAEDGERHEILVVMG